MKSCFIVCAFLIFVTVDLKAQKEIISNWNLTVTSVFDSTRVLHASKKFSLLNNDTIIKAPVFKYDATNAVSQKELATGKPIERDSVVFNWERKNTFGSDPFLETFRGFDKAIFTLTSYKGHPYATVVLKEKLKANTLTYRGWKSETFVYGGNGRIIFVALVYDGFKGGVIKIDGVGQVVKDVSYINNILTLKGDFGNVSFRIKEQYTYKSTYGNLRNNHLQKDVTGEIIQTTVKGDISGKLFGHMEVIAPK